MADAEEARGATDAGTGVATFFKDVGDLERDGVCAGVPGVRATAETARTSRTGVTGFVAVLGVAGLRASRRVCMSLSRRLSLSVERSWQSSGHRSSSLADGMNLAPRLNPTTSNMSSASTFPRRMSVSFLCRATGALAACAGWESSLLMNVWSSFSFTSLHRHELLGGGMVSSVNCVSISM